MRLALTPAFDGAVEGHRETGTDQDRPGSSVFLAYRKPAQPIPSHIAASVTDSNVYPILPAVHWRRYLTLNFVGVGSLIRNRWLSAASWPKQARRSIQIDRARLTHIHTHIHTYSVSCTENQPWRHHLGPCRGSKPLVKKCELPTVDTFSTPKHLAPMRCLPLADIHLILIFVGDRELISPVYVASKLIWNL
jgi:hypothetical protein